MEHILPLWLLRFGPWIVLAIALAAAAALAWTFYRVARAVRARLRRHG